MLARKKRAFQFCVTRTGFVAKQLIQTMRPNLSFMFVGDPLGAIISKFGLNSPENGKTPMTDFGKL